MVCIKFHRRKQSVILQVINLVTDHAFTKIGNLVPTKSVPSK